jgi:hypothetical protein
VQENRLGQRFGIEVIERGHGTWLVKPSGMGLPHPTHGVKRAIWCVGRWLCERHPALRVRHENLGVAGRDPAGDHS